MIDAPIPIDPTSWNAAIMAAAGTVCGYCGIGVPHAPGGQHAMWQWTGPQGEHFRPDRRRRQQGLPEYLPCAAADIRALLLREVTDGTAEG